VVGRTVQLKTNQAGARQPSQTGGFRGIPGPIRSAPTGAGAAIPRSSRSTRVSWSRSPPTQPCRPATIAIRCGSCAHGRGVVWRDRGEDNPRSRPPPALAVRPGHVWCNPPTVVPVVVRNCRHRGGNSRVVRSEQDANPRVEAISPGVVPSRNEKVVRFRLKTPWPA